MTTEAMKEPLVHLVRSGEIRCNAKGVLRRTKYLIRTTCQPCLREWGKHLKRKTKRGSHV